MMMSQMAAKLDGLLSADRKMALLLVAVAVLFLSAELATSGARAASLLDHSASKGHRVSSARGK